MSIHFRRWHPAAAWFALSASGASTRTTSTRSRAPQYKQIDLEQSTPRKPFTTQPKDPTGTMPTEGILGKISLFKRLKALERRRQARQNDGLSKHTLVSHGTALILVHDMLKQNWSVLLLERRFLQSSRHFTDYRSRNEVVDKLLAALEAYESALTHQFKCPKEVRYDLRSFERALFDATCALHAAGDQSVSHEVVERPRKGWQCTEEYEGWKGNFRALMNPGCGKLRIKERDVAEVGKLMDGHFTVTLFDADGKPSPEVPFCDALPVEFDGRGDDSNEESGPESELEVVLARTPQSRRGSLVIRLRNADAELDMPKAEAQPALTLRVKNEHV